MYDSERMWIPVGTSLKPQPRLRSGLFLLFDSVMVWIPVMLSLKSHGLGEGSAMPISLTNVLKWGGSGGAIVFATGLIVVVMSNESGAFVTLALVLMVASVAAAITGWLLERRKGSSGSESSASE